MLSLINEKESTFSRDFKELLICFDIRAIFIVSEIEITHNEIERLIKFMHASVVIPVVLIIFSSPSS